MAYRRDRAIVLRKETVRDYDRRYTLYGRDHGLCVALARGSARPKSRQAGHLEPFSEVDVMIASGKYTDHLAVAKQTSIFRLQGFQPSLFIGRFCDLVCRLVRPGVVDERLFDLLMEVRSVSQSFPQECTSARLRFLFAGASFKLLDILGYAPLLRGSESEMRVLHLLRNAPLHDALRLTTERDLLDRVAEYIEYELYSTYLDQDFQGAALFASYLT
ncbi:MAG: recombination protein O N-terminal domain-containing protein [bacterium]|nr:recombination protein O N-terminal domain-containing protein [bacterium]